MFNSNGAPQLYTAEQLKNWRTFVRSDENSDFPARPVGWKGLTLRRRLYLAWRVFIGDFDALDWRIYR